MVRTQTASSGGSRHWQAGRRSRPKANGQLSGDARLASLRLRILRHPALRVRGDPRGWAHPRCPSWREVFLDGPDAVQRVTGRIVATRTPACVALAELVAQIAGRQGNPVPEDIAVSRIAEIKITVADNL